MKYFLFSVFTFSTTVGLSEDLAKDEFKNKIAAFLNSEFNIFELPGSFYDCSYKEYEKTKILNFDEGYAAY